MDTARFGHGFLFAYWLRRREAVNSQVGMISPEAK
jgi:hypothetical protein